MSDTQWTRDLELEAVVGRKEGSAQLYAHPSGQLLDIIDRNLAGLYPDRELWLQSMMEFKAEAARGPQHILSERLLHGREFDQHITDLITGLAQAFKMSAEEFDYRPSDSPILDTMTRKVKARGRLKCLHDPVIFSGLVAYLSEASRRVVNGRIEMIDSWRSPGNWEPWILDPQDRAFNVWSSLFDMLQENEYGIALGVNIEIGMRRVRAYAPPPPRSDVQNATLTLAVKPKPSASDAPNDLDEEDKGGQDELQSPPRLIE
ncbi:MAG: hypothetical protein SGJ24_11640 [Chloroflexota bacterium]|nr:hypothetical protein [Chloroflexota bacterium]